MESSVGSENTRNKKYEYQDEKNSNQKEIFIKKGSQLKLKCELKKATEKPKFIFWYVLNFPTFDGKLFALNLKSPTHRSFKLFSLKHNAWDFFS